MKVIGMIPARMGSSRFPGKPLEKILGIPMVEHVYKRSEMSQKLNGLFVATPDKEIMEIVEGFGGEAIMTSPLHDRCTDRIAEAMENIEADIVVNIQGDEPMLYPDIIDMSVKPLIEDDSILCSNPIVKIHDIDTFNDRNQIKVVCNQKSFIMFMSREPIPTMVRMGRKIPMLKQVCIMPFRKDFLVTYNHLPQTPLEKAESVDMLRVLENGYQIKAVEVPSETFSVDTPQDLMKVEKLMKNDPLVEKYI
ncbi:MAG: 3-deoxy-manno-octulosonate cytidylyltransferase [Candidatus Methanoperedens sp.]|nr:3-deoxy-manno-octulosonate cytidylyltransferase [Candidatus Methanoperedens sp.]MCZ7394901.1 3-deoxy-manno-octulosonate cytidylyltransferase [Candidatus Methanoperedens sp.]